METGRPEAGTGAANASFEFSRGDDVTVGLGASNAAGWDQSVASERLLVVKFIHGKAC